LHKVIIMPAGPDETDHHAVGDVTEHVARNSSSKTDSNAVPKEEQVDFRHHEANPGPAVPKDFSAKQEGTKEERAAKAKELNQ
jgi:hypothetical protein